MSRPVTVRDVLDRTELISLARCHWILGSRDSFRWALEGARTAKARKHFGFAAWVRVIEAPAIERAA